MPANRVLLACPRFGGLSTWKQALSTDQDLTLVGEAVDPVDTLIQTRVAEANVVVLDLPPSGEDPGVASHLLAEFPDLKVIAVSESGRTAVLYERSVVRTQLHQLMPQDLAALLHSIERLPRG